MIDSLTPVPLWVSISFMILFAAPVIFIARTVYAGFRKTEEELYSRQVKNWVYLFYAFFFLVVSTVALTGFYEVNTLPPRVLVLGAVPLFLFYSIYLPSRKWFQKLLDHVSITSLVFIHSFRFVGVYFFVNYYYGTLPKSFAFIGGGGDILTAILALVFVYGIGEASKYAKAYLWVFNMVGLADILSVLVTAVIITRQALAGGSDGVSSFGTFPFVWIPAFAPATIIFLHILIFKKLLDK